MTVDKNGVRGDELVLQIVQYRTEGIWMTVSSRPESTLVFFDNDGSAIPLLGTTSVDDIQAGITATVGEATAIYQFGFNLTQVRNPLYVTLADGAIRNT